MIRVNTDRSAQRIDNMTKMKVGKTRRQTVGTGNKKEKGFTHFKFLLILGQPVLLTLQEDRKRTRELPPVVDLRRQPAAVVRQQHAGLLHQPGETLS